VSSARWRHPASRVLLASLAAQVALVVSGPLVVRMLGVSDRGRLALVFAVVLLVSQVGVAGVPAAVTWFVASRRLDAAVFLARLQRRFVRQVVGCSVLAAAVVVVLDLVGHPLPQPWLLAVIAGAGVAAVMAAMLGMAALQGQQRFGVLARLQPLPAVSYALATAFLLVTGGGSVALLLAINLAGWALVAVVSLRLVGRHGPDSRADVTDWPSPLDVRTYARSALVTTAAPIDTLGIEQLLVGLIGGHYLLGLFSIGWAFETGPVVLLVALASFVGPRVSAMEAVERPAFVRRWLLVAAGLGVAACLLIQLVLAPVLVLAFGADAEPAVPLARVLVVAGVVLGLRRFTSACLVGLGRAAAATRAEMAGLGLMLAGFAVMAVSSVDGTYPGYVLLVAGGVTLAGHLAVLARAASSGARASG
jgi:O-antigen/teichoic acid export membrane protein